jgi:hypothetical protein
MGITLTSPKNADSNFVSTRGGYFDVFNLQGLAGTPAHGGFAGNRLSSCVRHLRREDRQKILEPRRDETQPAFIRGSES